MSLHVLADARVSAVKKAPYKGTRGKRLVSLGGPNVRAKSGFQSDARESEQAAGKGQRRELTMPTMMAFRLCGLELQGQGQRRAKRFPPARRWRKVLC